MNICKQGTEHETATAMVLCNAGNPSLGCSEMLFATIQWPEIMEASPEAVGRAKANLHNRLGFSWSEIDKQERETRV